jgi:Ankyrin repeats (3 copies)
MKGIIQFIWLVSTTIFGLGYRLYLILVLQWYNTRISWENMHYTAIESHQFEEVVLKMIELLPSAVKETNREELYPLHLACKAGSETLIMKLLEMFPLAASIPSSGKSFALHLACDYYKSLAVIQKLVSLYPTALNMKDSLGWYPIHNATYSGHNQNGRQVINYLIEVDPLSLKRQCRKDGRTALHVAVKCQSYDSYDMVRYLVHDQDVPINMKDNDGMTPLLHLACQRMYRHEGMVNILLQHPNIDVNERDKWYQTPIQVINTDVCSISVMEELLSFPSAGINLNNSEVKELQARLKRSEYDYRGVSQLLENMQTKQQKLMYSSVSKV